MKYILILLWAIYIIWAIAAYIFFAEKEIDLEDIKKSIVIVVPENELISYKNNPMWAFEDSKSSWIWAWFFISNDWMIQTANHIIENDNINYKVIYDNKEYTPIIISRDPTKDLAVIKIKYNHSDSQQRALALWKGEVKQNDIVYSFWIDTENMEIIYNSWKILQQKSKLENMSNLLEISNPLKPGFSWWPIINSKAKVIWINYAISDWKNYWIILKK